LLFVTVDHVESNGSFSSFVRKFRETAKYGLHRGSSGAAQDEAALRKYQTV
jgi:hypothetical protein